MLCMRLHGHADVVSVTDVILNDAAWWGAASFLESARLVRIAFLATYAQSEQEAEHRSSYYLLRLVERGGWISC